MKLEVGKKYRLNNGEEHVCDRTEGNSFIINGCFYQKDGRFLGYGKDDPWSVACEVVEEETPKLWRDMTDEEKGALLLAHHEGNVIEICHICGDWYQTNPDWSDDVAYRVRPEPKRETVAMYLVEICGVWVSDDSTCGNDTHLITFETLDGEPDCDSIKMEKL